MEPASGFRSPATFIGWVGFHIAPVYVWESSQLWHCWISTGWMVWSPPPPVVFCTQPVVGGPVGYLPQLCSAQRLCTAPWWRHCYIYVVISGIAKAYLVHSWFIYIFLWLLRNISKWKYLCPEFSFKTVWIDLGKCQLYLSLATPHMFFVSYLDQLGYVHSWVLKTADLAWKCVLNN